MSKWIRNEHTTEYHDLTPELARELLALSRGNRGIRPIIKSWEKWVSGQSASKDHMRWRTDGSEYFPRITGIPVNW